MKVALINQTMPFELTHLCKRSLFNVQCVVAAIRPSQNGCHGQFFPSWHFEFLNAIQNVMCANSDKTLTRSGIFLSLQPHPPLVPILIFHQKIVRFRLRRTMDVGAIQQVLDSKHNLFHTNCWSPSLFLIQNTQTNSTRWINVWAG